MANVIGIDVGGTKIAGVLLNDKHKIIKRYVRATEAHKDKSQIIMNIIEVIERLRDESVTKAGIGMPGFYDKRFYWGSPNIRNLIGTDIKKEIKKKINLDVTIENDTNCFTLAEQRLGAGKGCKDIIGVIHGTGVGVGIIIDGQLRGVSKRGFAEGGHSKIIIDKEIKEVESIISGPNLISYYGASSEKTISSPKDIYDRRKKDKAAKETYEKLILCMGLFLSNIIQLINPECIVIGGGVSNLPYYKDLRKIVEKHAAVLGKGCRIKKSSLGDDSGAIGAALLALE